MTKIAIIRISGEQGLNRRLKDTFKNLNLHKKYTCVLVENTESFKGMIKRIKDHITWGEIDKETLNKLIEERGKLPGNKRITEEYSKKNTKKGINELSEEIFNNNLKIKDIPGLKPFFRLNPPRKGFESKGTKKHFSLGGALGYRKDKINDLIKRML